MPRSELTIDLRAVRRNVDVLRRALGSSELWAVVKADGYGHGASDVAGAALGAGASALCVATVAEALPLRPRFPDARILIMGPAADAEVAQARDARLELAVSREPLPEGIPIHLKLDTGMGRYGFRELPPLADNVVGLMTHLATADTDLTFAEVQIDRFRRLASHTGLTMHAANSAAALRIPAARFDAARCGIALYGLSPFGTSPSDDGLEPVLSWRSRIAQVTRLDPGESTGYGRRFVARRKTWIGLVPVGYADGFRRDLTRTQVLVAGALRRVVGTVSMDSFAVELDAKVSIGTPVTIVGDGLLLERHAEYADTITYELACGINSSPTRCTRRVLGA